MAGFNLFYGPVGSRFPNFNQLENLWHHLKRNSILLGNLKSIEFKVLRIKWY